MPRWNYDYDPYGPRSFGGVPYRDDSKWVDPRNTKEKWDNPYSYSEFFIFGNRQIIKEKGVHGIYSDRVHEWWYQGGKEHKQYEKLWMRYVGKRYENASAEELSKFFTAYNKILWPKQNKNKTVKVVALAEGCNISNGYPYWIIWYVECPTTTKRSMRRRKKNASPKTEPSDGPALSVS